MYIDSLNSPVQAAVTAGASSTAQVATARPVSQTDTDSTVRAQSTDGEGTQASAAAKTAPQSSSQKQQTDASAEMAPTTIAQADTQTADTRTPEERAKAEQEKIKDAVEKMKAQLPNSEVKFGIHEETNRVTIKILDKDTGEVVKEVPPEKTLDAIAKCMELAGMFMDEAL